MKRNKLDNRLRASLRTTTSPVSVVVTYRTEADRDQDLHRFGSAVPMAPRSLATTLPTADVKLLADHENVLVIKLGETAQLLG